MTDTLSHLATRLTNRWSIRLTYVERPEAGTPCVPYAGVAQIDTRDMTGYPASRNDTRRGYLSDVRDGLIRRAGAGRYELTEAGAAKAREELAAYEPHWRM